MSVADSLSELKVMWFAVSVVGFVVSVFVAGEIWADLYFVLKRRDLKMRKARIIILKQAFGSATVMTLAQTTFALIRFGAIWVAPAPEVEGFRKFWSIDGTMVAFLSIVITVFQIWQVTGRGSIHQAVDQELEKIGSVDEHEITPHPRDINSRA